MPPKGGGLCTEMTSNTFQLFSDLYLHHVFALVPLAPIDDDGSGCWGSTLWGADQRETSNQATILHKLAGSQHDADGLFSYFTMHIKVHWGPFHNFPLWNIFNPWAETGFEIWIEFSMVQLLSRRNLCVKRLGLKVKQQVLTSFCLIRQYWLKMLILASLV